MSFRKLNPIQRRRQVARLRLRGLSTREIADALTRSGEKVVHSTIVRDLQAIEVDWRQAAAGDLAAHKARLLAENQELRRVQWSKPDPDAAAIQRSLDFEAKLLGLYTYTPPAVAVEEQLLEMGLDPDHVLAQVERILAGNTE